MKPGTRRAAKHGIGHMLGFRAQSAFLAAMGEMHVPQ